MRLSIKDWTLTLTAWHSGHTLLSTTLLTFVFADYLLVKYLHQPTTDLPCVRQSHTAGSTKENRERNKDPHKGSGYNNGQWDDPWPSSAGQSMLAWTGNSSFFLFKYVLLLLFFLLILISVQSAKWNMHCYELLLLHKGHRICISLYI